jgi:Holliday junction resolvasome RuvABC endonuclease subunit
MKKVLGLDISSSTIGWGILEYDDKTISLVEYGHFKPLSKKKAEKKGLGYSSRIDSAYKAIYDLVKQKRPDDISIEEYARRFSKNKSTANTIIVLATFNESVALSCLHAMNIEPAKHPVTSMRSKVSKALDVELKSKDDVFPFVEKTFSNFLPTKTRYGNIKKEHYDEADGIFAALAHIIMESGNTDWKKIG